MFRNREGVYFNCSGVDSLPGYKVISYYSFATNTITDFIASGEEGTIRAFPPREAWEWEFVAKNPHEVKMPEEINDLPYVLRRRLRLSDTVLEGQIKSLIQARACTELLL